MNKNTIIALGVFGLLIVLTIVSTSEKAERGMQRMSLTHVETERIDKIKISGKKSAELVKQSDHWTVQGKRADKNAVKQLLEAIGKVASKDLVTTNQERFAELEVDEEKGLVTEVFSGGKSRATFVVGKIAAGGAVHIRVKDEVYLVKGVRPTLFARDASAWVDKKLFEVKLGEVNRVEVALRGEPPYALVKKEKDWSVEEEDFPEGFRYDKMIAARMVSSLVHLRAQEVVVEDPGVEVSGIDDQADRLTFFAKAEDEEEARRFELRLGKSADKIVYAQIAGRDEFWKLSESSVKGVRKVPMDFRSLALMTLERDQVVGIDIQGEKERLRLEKEEGGLWKISSSSSPIPKDFELDPKAVSRRITALINAKGIEMAEGVSVGGAGLSKARQYVKASLKDGSKVILAFGKDFEREGRKMVYAQGNADNALYVMADFSRNSLTGGVTTFQKREASPGSTGPGLAGLDPKTLEGLPPEVRKSLEEQIAKQKREQLMMQRLKTQMKAQ